MHAVLGDNAKRDTTYAQSGNQGTFIIKADFEEKKAVPTAAGAKDFTYTYIEVEKCMGKRERVQSSFS